MIGDNCGTITPDLVPICKLVCEVELGIGVIEVGNIDMAGSDRRFMRSLSFITFVAAALALSACGTTGSTPARHGDYSGGHFKVGDPYQIDGQWYYPREDPSYNETGIASWYGEQFNGRPTANGETFDMTLYTAAHKTLPMPIHAEVTNLENGRSIMVRINDRGPFVQGRIIDLSRAAAQELGFRQNGTARVRVRAMGRAPLNTSTAEARDVMQGRGTTRVASSAPSSSIQAASLTPPGASSSTASRSQPQNVDAPRQSRRTRVAVPTDIYVQAGSFSVEDNAVSMSNGLRRTSNGAPVTINPTWVDGQQFYRVRLGPFPTVDEADAMLAQVVDSGHRAARIVVE